jgi:hypothetical protein
LAMARPVTTPRAYMTAPTMVSGRHGGHVLSGGPLSVAMSRGRQRRFVPLCAGARKSAIRMAAATAAATVERLRTSPRLARVLYWNSMVSIC